MASNFADLPDPFNNLLRLLLLNVHVWRRKAWPPWLRMHASLRANHFSSAQLCHKSLVDVVPYCTLLNSRIRAQRSPPEVDH